MIQEVVCLTLPPIPPPTSPEGGSIKILIQLYQLVEDSIKYKEEVVIWRVIIMIFKITSSWFVVMREDQTTCCD